MLRVTGTLFALLLLHGGCQAVKDSKSELDIRDGEPTKAFPAVGFLNINNTNSCTGTLLSPQVVLAAAHCVTHDNFSPFRPQKNIRFEVGGKSYNVARFEQHPDYMDYLDACVKATTAKGQKLFKDLLACQDEESYGRCDSDCNICTEKAECVACLKKVCGKEETACTGDQGCQSLKTCKADRKVDEYPHDLSLLYLAQPVPKIKPMAVGRAPSEGEKITLLGFGPTSPERLDELGIKSRGETTVGEVYERVFNYHGSGMKRANLLGGDSGGPSFTKRGGKSILVGVHSHVSSYCDAQGDLVGVDIRIDAYRDWLREKVENLQIEAE